MHVCAEFVLIATMKKIYNSGGRHDIGAYTKKYIVAAYVSDLR